MPLLSAGECKTGRLVCVNKQEYLFPTVSGRILQDRAKAFANVEWRENTINRVDSIKNNRMLSLISISGENREARSTGIKNKSLDSKNEEVKGLDARINIINNSINCIIF